MSARRFDYQAALTVAEGAREKLSPYCERVEIVGSLRRRRPTVGDIELLFIPKTGTRAVDLLETEAYSLADQEIDRWLSEGRISKRPSKTGVFAWGAKNKLAVHNASGIPLDLFATSADNWWVSLVVRTGGREHNLKLTTGAQALGRSLLAYGCGVRCSDGNIIRAASEEHVHELCGVPYLPPEERS